MLQPKQSHPLASLNTLQIGLMWDFLGDPIDLDATVVLLNDLGQIVDAVFYNNLVSKCGSVIHSGDNKDGRKDGFDEIVSVDFLKLNYSVSYMAVLVSSYQGVGFKNIETATVTFMHDG